MRIAVCNSFARTLGGIENYLDRLIPELVERGHEIAAVFETDEPRANSQIGLAAARRWLKNEPRMTQTLDELLHWGPDIVFTNGVGDPDFESRVIRTAPAVHFAHDYSSTCVSGSKTNAFPRMAACSRTFGPKCLLNYFPRRCGGLSPVTLRRRYRFASKRLQTMREYAHILVASEAMHVEFLRNDFSRDRIEVLPYPVPSAESSTNGGANAVSNHFAAGLAEPSRQPLNLLFGGRMVALKGGDLLIEALPLAAARLKRSLVLTFAGDGPERSRWETQARSLCARNSALTVRFVGWLDGHSMTELINASDLLVIPSLWPEPFGLIGPEAGMSGLPAAAFATGGITEWLHDGVNGFLAPADPATPAGLAKAIIDCLIDPTLYCRLRSNARIEASKFSIEVHTSRLVEIFSRVVAEARAPGIEEVRQG